ncbi:MAG: hypothetical protein ABR587_15510, partial [Candidatus Binatia bacterium]
PSKMGSDPIFFETEFVADRGRSATLRAQKMGSDPIFGCTVFALIFATVVLGMPGVAVAQSQRDSSRRDEFGLMPRDSADKDLSLPDPVLDRGWPAPKPGDNSVPPPNVAPDEDELDPFDEEIAPAPEPPPTWEDEEPEQPDSAPEAPDGRPDPGSPL